MKRMLRKFQCKDGCSNCCQIKNLIVTPADVTKWIEGQKNVILSHLRVLELKGKEGESYVALALHFPKMKCSFLKRHKCTIYEDRPTVCKLFPYNVDEEDNKIPLTGYAIDTCPVFYRYDLIYSPRRYRFWYKQIMDTITFQDALLKTISAQKKKIVVNVGDVI
jgi:Fe-S-cluster containining protein